MICLYFQVLASIEELSKAVLKSTTNAYTIYITVELIYFKRSTKNHKMLHRSGFIYLHNTIVAVKRYKKLLFIRLGKFTNGTWLLRSIASLFHILLITLHTQTSCWVFLFSLVTRVSPKATCTARSSACIMYPTCLHRVYNMPNIESSNSNQ